MKNLKKNTGFTLIELMVVISIISFLSSIIFASLSGIKAKANDAKVAQEVDQTKLKFEVYNSGHGGYPNPEPVQLGSDPAPKAYCIGATDCKLAGVPITTNINSVVPAENGEPAFPVFPHNNTFKDTSNRENTGYIYLSCGSSAATCPADSATIIYSVSNSVKATNVGTWTSVVCDPSLCPTTNDPVYGCMNASATNYNSLATVDDGSCTYAVSGCTDASACNYNSAATVDDGSCENASCHGGTCSGNIQSTYCYQDDNSACIANPACRWTETIADHCGGSLTDCTALDASSCGQAPGCTYDDVSSTCSGNRTDSCADYTDPSTCSQNGCSFGGYTPAGCSSNPNADCATISNQDSCTIAGCSWSMY